jgi:hypothetical protein
MRAFRISDPLLNEHLVAVTPSPFNDDDPGWRRRLHFFTGRSLNHQALITEQQHRAGHLTLRGQQLSPGVVEGLEAAIAAPNQLQILPGTGLSQVGEDVRLPREHLLSVDAVQVYAPSEILEGQELPPPDDTISDSPLRPRRIGRSLRQLIDAGISLPPVAILMLQPAVAENIGSDDLNDPCPIDVQGLAFADRQLIDGARFLLYPWPTELEQSLPLPILSDPTDAASVNRWRSQLAYSIFRYELSQLSPWGQIGVPLALLGFDANGQLLFCDRNAVVRQGGRALHAALPIEQAGTPFLWQARIEQFAEQLTELDLTTLPGTQLVNYFAHLPPVGLLPTSIMENLDQANRQQRFFPIGYHVQAAPVPLEQLDTVFQESASLVPFNTVSNDAADQVQILVPVPQRWYDPQLLVTAVIDPEFIETQTEFIERRAAWLHRRQLVRSRASGINEAITGEPIRYPEPDPDRLEDDEKAQPNAPFSSTRAHQSALVRGLHEHGFENAGAPLTVQANDRLTTYIYLDVDAPPTQIMMQWHLGDDREHRAYWGTSLIQRGQEDTASRRRIDDLPDPGQWVRLEVPIAAVGIDPNSVLTGLTFSLFDGRAAWGHSGRAVANADPGQDEVWVGDAVPDAATLIENNEPWLWLTSEELLTPFEDRYEIEEVDTDVPVVRPVVDLQTQLTADSPIDRDAVRLPLLNRVQVQVQLPTDLSPPFEIPFGLGRKLSYEKRRRILTTLEPFTANERETLLSLYSGNENYQAAITSLANLAVASSQPAEQLRAILSQIPETLSNKVEFDATANLLKVQGVLTTTERDQLLALVPASDAVSDTVRNAFRSAVTELYDQSQDNTLLTALDDIGLEAFITRLETLVDQADDQIEFGFLQVRTDMFRVRQFILGTEEATRLAVSPTLAAISKGESAATIQKDLNQFFSQLKPQPQEAIAVSLEASPEIRGAAQPLASTTTLTSLTTTASRTLSSALRGELVQPTRGTIVSREPTRTVDRILQPEAKAEEKLVLEAQAKPTATLFTRETQQVITQQSPLIGKVNQSIVVAERLQDPPAPEARNYSLAGQVTVVNNLAKVGIFKDLPVPGAQDFTFGQINQRPGRLPIDPDDLSENPDEAEYVASSVRVLDDTVSALRLAEGRVAAYRQAIALARRTLTQLQQLRQAAILRLETIAGELAEARHDVSVVRALLAEERQRIDDINQRRRTILQDRVEFLVYHRPRSIGPNPDVPSRPLDPGITLPAEPTCLQQRWPLPDALQEAADLLREAPVKWFTQIPPLLVKLDRPELLVNALQQAQLVAQQPLLSAKPGLQRFAQTPAVFTQAIYQTFTAQQQVVSRFRQQVAQLDISQVTLDSWQRARDRAQDVLTLGDLIDQKQARSDLSRAAAAEFEKLTRALGCLYAGFGTVRPVLRLNWAERLSQYDAPINLRNLTSLPQWNEIDYRERRRLQSVADWLYLRVAAREPDAIALINDLVRICLLLASEAPVDQMIAGYVSEPTPVIPGRLVPVTIDPAKVRIGMKTLLYGQDNRIVAEGIVDDLADARAATRIVKTLTPNLQLSANTRVHFVETTTFTRFSQTPPGIV